MARKKPRKLTSHVRRTKKDVVLSFGVPEYEDQDGVRRSNVTAIFRLTFDEAQKLSRKLWREVKPVTPGKRACEARQYSDSMVCRTCKTTWDVNDTDPPECRKVKEASTWGL